MILRICYICMCAICLYMYTCVYTSIFVYACIYIYMCMCVHLIQCTEDSLHFLWWDESCFRSTCIVAIAVRINVGTSTATWSKAEWMTSVSWQRWDAVRWYPTDGQIDSLSDGVWLSTRYLRSLFAAKRNAMQWNEKMSTTCTFLQQDTRHFKTL